MKAMMTTRSRAPKGGLVAINGEWYSGGEFLPSTELPSRNRDYAKAGSGKQEVAPYTWELAPEGKRSIYKQVAGLFGKVIDGKMVINTSEQALAAYGKTLAEVEALADRWNHGERWV